MGGRCVKSVVCWAVVYAKWQSRSERPKVSVVEAACHGLRQCRCGQPSEPLQSGRSALQCSATSRCVRAEVRAEGSGVLGASTVSTRCTDLPTTTK